MGEAVMHILIGLVLAMVALWVLSVTVRVLYAIYCFIAEVLALIRALYHRFEEWIQAAIGWTLIIGLTAGLVAAVIQRDWPTVMRFLQTSPMLIMLLVVAYEKSPLRLDLVRRVSEDAVGPVRYFRLTRQVAPVASKTDGPVV
jgi:uncharacterized membrane protein YeaQ/YmgE (transglycosylase-associated protein family)